jgi:hypothetical protein
MPTATVLIPTHSHGRLLDFAVQSALDQTVSDIEVVIVGDGADEATRAAATAHVARDRRVRFFDNPKGARHGEALRHEALQAARGDIVCYLSDDDLWLPQHIEGLAGALADADFAHVLPLYVSAAQEISVHGGHLSAGWSRARIETGINFIPLSAAAHTRAFYKRLPHGWRPAPPDCPTDLYMWQQMLAADGCRAMSTMRATLLNFPAPMRTGWSLEQRAAELSGWSARLRVPELERELMTAALDRLMRWHVDTEQSVRAAVDSADSLRAAVSASEAERAALSQRAAELSDHVDAAVREAARARRLTDAMERTITWRLRNRLLALKPVAAWARRRARPESAP